GGQVTGDGETALLGGPGSRYLRSAGGSREVIAERQAGLRWGDGGRRGGGSTGDEHAARSRSSGYHGKLPLHGPATSAVAWVVWLVVGDSVVRVVGSGSGGGSGRVLGR